MRFLITLEKKSHVKKAFKNLKKKNRFLGRLWMRGPIDFWLNLLSKEKTLEEEHFYPILKHLWRKAHQIQNPEEIPNVEARLFNVDSSFYYLQSGLKKDILLPKGKYYVSGKIPSWFKLDGLDLRIACKKKLFGHYRYKRWFWSNWYYRKKIAKLYDYYRLSMFQQQEEDQVQKHSQYYVSKILSNGVFVHWREMESRFCSRPSWEVHYPLYESRKNFLKHFFRKEISSLIPLSRHGERKLQMWTQANFFFRRPYSLRRKKRRLFRRRKKGYGLFKWYSSSASTLLILRKSGEVVRQEVFVSNVSFLEVEAVHFFKCHNWTT